MGGKEVSDPNPVVQVAFVKPAMDLAAKDGNKPEDLVSIALGVETLAAETYQQFTPLLTVPKLRGSLMSVGGVEARHAAILTKAAPTGQPVPPVTTVPNTTTTTLAATTTTAGRFPDAANNAAVYQVPGPFQPLTSVQITIGINTINMDPLGPNSYLYEYNIVS